MSLLGMAWRFCNRLRDRRASRYGGNDSTSEPEPNTEPPEYGLEFIAEEETDLNWEEDL